jgi:hypothetical protein
MVVDVDIDVVGDVVVDPSVVDNVVVNDNGWVNVHVAVNDNDNVRPT